MGVADTDVGAAHLETKVESGIGVTAFLVRGGYWNWVSSLPLMPWETVVTVVMDTSAPADPDLDLCVSGGLDTVTREILDDSREWEGDVWVRCLYC